MQNFQKLPPDECSPDVSQNQRARVQISVSLYIASLLAARRLMAFVTVLSVALACLYLLVSPPVYVAKALIAPSSSSGSTLATGLSSTLSAVSGMGVSFGGGGGASFDNYLQVITSTRLAAKLMREDGVMEHLFSASWDEKQRRWVPYTDLFGPAKNLVKRALGMPASLLTPDILAKRLQKMINLENAPSTGGLSSALRSQITIVTLKYKDRDFALTLLNDILRGADEIIRQDQLANISNRIDYLKLSIKKTADVNLSNSLSLILMDQERTLMVLKADKYFAVNLLDPPNADPAPSGFSFILTLLLSVVLGLVVSAAVVFIIVRQRAAQSLDVGGAPLAQPFPDPFEYLLIRVRRQFDRSARSSD